MRIHSQIQEESQNCVTPVEFACTFRLVCLDSSVLFRFWPHHTLLRVGLYLGVPTILVLALAAPLGLTYSLKLVVPAFSVVEDGKCDAGVKSSENGRSGPSVATGDWPLCLHPLFLP